MSALRSPRYNKSVSFDSFGDGAKAAPTEMFSPPRNSSLEDTFADNGSRSGSYPEALTSSPRKYGIDEEKPLQPGSLPPSFFQTLGYWEPNNKLHRTFQAITWQNNRGAFAAVWMASTYFLIGILVGCVAFLVKKMISVLTTLKFNMTFYLLSAPGVHPYINYGSAYCMFVGYSLVLVSIASFAIMQVPAAKASGVPEVIAYLNGVAAPKAFLGRALVAKIISVVTAVATNLPIGPEGPMIHIGAMIGSSVMTKTNLIRMIEGTRSKSRTNRGTRDYVTAGAAAGVAAAFKAPIGGFLFVIEEVLSFFNVQLLMYILVSSLCSALAITVLMQTFCKSDGFGVCESLFGQIVFKPTFQLQGVGEYEFKLFSLVPTIVMGVWGGLTGAFFTKLNLYFVRLRAKHITPWTYSRFLEPLGITLLWSTICFFTPLFTPCAPVSTINLGQETILPNFHCQEGSYSPMAALTMNDAEHILYVLFDRGPLIFDIKYLILFFFLYFIFAAVTSGTNIACGLVIPSMVLGAVAGRILGETLNIAFTALGFAKLEPGLWAVIGAVSIFGGMSRLTFSLVVIIVEMTNQLSLTFVIMLAVIVSKVTADMICPSLYHGLMHFRGLPYLETEPGDEPRLECIPVSKIMNVPVATISLNPTLLQVLELLTRTSHGAFPVIDHSRKQQRGSFCEGPLKGIITRSDLILVLQHYQEDRDLKQGQWEEDMSKENFSFGTPPLSGGLLEELLAGKKKQSQSIRGRTRPEAVIAMEIGFPSNSNPGTPDTGRSPHLSPAQSPWGPRRSPSPMMLESYFKNIQSKSYLENSMIIPSELRGNQNDTLDIMDYLDTSPFIVTQSMSVSRVFHLFRSLGLRHVIVVDGDDVMGMVTRKDLIHSKLETVLEEHEDMYTLQSSLADSYHSGPSVGSFSSFPPSPSPSPRGQPARFGHTKFNIYDSDL